MIYKDVGSSYDTENDPAERVGNCLHCNQNWNYHYGWCCDTTVEIFSACRPERRYVTASMRDSIAGGVIEPKAKSYECPCGIVRVDCTYHQG